MEKANCIVCQSGGPTSVINASLYGVIKEAKKHNQINNIYGALNGIVGVIEDKLIDLRKLDEENLDLLKQTPSAILGSVRHCLNTKFDEEYKKILNVLQKHNIRYFYYIGGNDSMDTVAKLSAYLNEVQYSCFVIGIPKTIDNDLEITDHTPGYGSAIKYIASAINEIKEDTKCYIKGRVTIVEIMGRDAGWLTAATKLACLNQNAPDLIYLPEVAFDTEKFLQDVERIYQKQQKVLVCVSEGIKDKTGEYVQNQMRRYAVQKDKFSHIQLGGIAAYLTSLVKHKLNLPVRGIELNLLQRCASHIASESDIYEAIHCGEYAVIESLKQITGKVVIMRRENLKNYNLHYEMCDVNQIANKVKFFPKEWILNENDIHFDFISYALPLMDKQYHCIWKNGMVAYTKLNQKELSVD